MSRHSQTSWVNARHAAKAAPAGCCLTRVFAPAKLIVMGSGLNLLVSIGHLQIVATDAAQMQRRFCRTDASVDIA
jgi:hypothetical protein